MRVAARACIASGIAWSMVSGASNARADDSAVAQALFDQAKKAMAAHDFADACPKFEESYRLEPAMGALLNLADCYEQAGKLATAWSKFLELATKAQGAGQAQRARIGRQRAAALAPRLSRLVINASSASQAPGLEVLRDGTVVGPAEWGTPLPADSGAHTIEAAAPGRKRWSTSVDLGSHATTLTVVVPDLAPLPPEPTAARPEPTPGTAGSESPGSHRPVPPQRDVVRGGIGAQKILAIVSFGVGLAGVGVGSYFGLVSVSKHADAMNACSQPVCMGPGAEAGVALWNDARKAGDFSTVAFIVGGAGVAGGLLLWFTAPRTEGSPAPQAEVGLGPGTIQLKGVW